VQSVLHLCAFQHLRLMAGYPAMATVECTRLCAKNVAEIPGYTPFPYDRESMVPGLVHLGVGAFHRAHQAVIHHKALATMSKEDAQKWGIVGVSLRRPDVRDQLAPQDSLYTVHERAGKDTNVLVIGCLQRCLVAPEDPGAVLELLASPTVRIVTLTVTEKGYCYEPATRALDLSNADIVHDLLPENAKKPRSAIGFLVLALKLRRDAKMEPFTVVPCDNLPHNGQTVKGICVAFASQLDKDGDLSTWIASSVFFPSTMVDCIVPATKQAEIEKAAAEKLNGLHDEAMVVCEPFRQWVVQDTFGPLGRPPWDKVGAQLVQDVATFEELKLGVLNGCHSTLAYCGFLCGIEYIWQVMAKDAFPKLCHLYHDGDVLPVLASPPGVDTHEYARAVADRFKNSALEHRTFQVAMDGSQKLPQRLLGIASKNLQRTPANLQVIPLAVAAWMRYVSRLDENGAAIKVQDPLAERFASIAVASKGNARELATSLFAIKSIFGDDVLLQAKDEFIEPVIQHLEKLIEASGEDAVYAYLCEFVARGQKRDSTEVS